MEKNMLKKLSIFLISVVLAHNVYAAVDDIVISKPWARASIADKNMSAAYMNIKNNSSESDVLYKAISEVAGKIELHKVVINDNGVAQMVEMNKIVIPAMQEVILKPKGLHIMLFEIKKPLRDGEEIKMELYFEKAGKISVTMPIKSIAHTADEHHKH